MKKQIALACLLALTGSLPAKPLPRLEPMPPMEAGKPFVVMETNHGKVVMELFADKAPITVKNFLQYVDDRHYDGTIVHRVVPNFVIQGGGFAAGMKSKPERPPIQNEAGNGLSNERGALAAARASNPDSATAQFYINLKDNKFIDRANSPDKVGYAVFGKVVEGMDVIDRIARVPTLDRAGHSNVPAEDVVILSIRRGSR